MEKALKIIFGLILGIVVLCLALYKIKIFLGIALSIFVIYLLTCEHWHSKFGKNKFRKPEPGE